MHTLSLALQNGNGTGLPSDDVMVTSCDGAALPPVGVVAVTESSSAVFVRWQAPPPPVPGMVVGYVVRYRRSEGLGDYATLNITNTSSRYVGHCSL